MDKLDIYNMCLYDDHLENVKALGYIPVGLGKENFRSEWLKDNEGKNISHKNLYYGEYSFYYWFWKNKLDKVPDNKWIGFSHYRHHWSNQDKIKSDDLNNLINSNNYSHYILKEPHTTWESYQVILGDHMYVNKGYRLSKILKNGFDEKIVKRIWQMIKNSEFKRYQSPIGPKVTKMSLSADRRFPLTNKFELQ